MKIYRILLNFFIGVIILTVLNGCLNEYIANKHDTMDTGTPDKTLNIIEDISPSTVELPWPSEYITLELGKVSELKTVETNNQIIVNDSAIIAYVHAININEINDSGYGIEVESRINSSFNAKNLSIMFPGITVYNEQGNKVETDTYDFYRVERGRQPRFFNYNYLTSKFRIAGLYRFKADMPGHYYIVIYPDSNSNKQVFSHSHPQQNINYYPQASDNSDQYKIVVAPWQIFTN